MTIVGLSATHQAVKVGIGTRTDLLVIPAIWRHSAPVPRGRGNHCRPTSDLLDLGLGGNLQGGIVEGAAMTRIKMATYECERPVSQNGCWERLSRLDTKNR